ncbi:MAG: hypothetical protein WCL27_09325 [Betaproteobacteria bacterium]
MENDSETPEVIEETTVTKSKFPVVIVLSVLLGIAVLVVAIGGVLFYQRSKALHAEVNAVKKEMKEKYSAYVELQKQVEALSQQMNVLKEYSIARSGGESKALEAQSAAVAESVPPGLKPVPENLPAIPAKANAAALKSNQVAAVAPAPEIVPPQAQKVVRQKPEGQSCELVGKSAEEQAATLKRCVGLMDAPKERSRTK